MKKYLQLATLIFRFGSWKGSGQNFNLSRANSLENLQEFVPHKSGVKTNPAEKSSGNNLLAQAAFIKSAFKKKGGHLCAQNLCYIRIPKAANTSIGYEMLVKKYPDLKDKKVDETQINFLSDVNLCAVEDAETETFFTVVRNPFARLVSVYRDFFETSGEKFIYQDYLFGILAQKISFTEFVNRINRIPDPLKDQHIKPQYLFIEPYERKGIEVKIFRLEEKQSLGSFLNDQGMELTHRNKSREPYDYAQYYNNVLIRQVYNIYKKDIETFGYREAYGNLKERFKA